MSSLIFFIFEKCCFRQTVVITISFLARLDTQHNDVQDNDAQHNWLNCDVYIKSSVIMLSVTFLIF